MIAAGYTVTPTSLNTSEGGGTQTFTVVLTAAPASNVVFSVTSGDTSEGTVSPGTLTFTPGNYNVAQTVTVTPVDDPAIDGNITYDVTVSVVDGSSDNNFDPLADQTVSVTNADNDAAGYTVTPTSLNTSEGGGTQTFTVVLTAAPASNVVFSVTSGDTSEGTVSPGTLTFTPGNYNVAQTVTVTPVDDPAIDGNITYDVTVSVVDGSSDNNFDPLADQTVSVTNADNDAAGYTVTPTSLNTSEGGGTQTFTVVLTAAPASNVVFSVTSGDTSEGTVSPGTLTFTPGNYNVAQTVTVTPVDDPAIDGNITYDVTVSVVDGSSDNNFDPLADQTVSVTNADNDAAGYTVTPTSLNTSEGGGTQTFTVVLTAAPASNVVFSVTSGDTSEGTVSPGTLTFTPGNYNVAQTVTVTPVDDPAIDGNITYDVTVSVVDGSSDNNFDPLADQTVSVTNADNDAAGYTVTPTSLNTSEGGGTQTFTVVLMAAPASNVVFSVTSGDTSEGTVSPGTLTFTPGNYNVAQTVTVTPVDDPAIDGNITYDVTVSVVDASSDNAFDPLADQTVSVTNADNDAAGYTVTPTSLGTTEGGGTQTFTVVLTAAPASNVVFSVTSGDTSEGTVSPGTLTFTPGNYNVAQTVTVTPVEDPAIDGNKPITLR